MQELAQAVIDIITWFLVPFSIIVAVSWVVSFFRSN